MSRIITTLLFTALYALAQFDSAAVVGSVRDEKGGPLSGAKVVLRNNDTGIIQTTNTTETGDFVFPSVRIGIYKLTAEMQGFTTASAENISITVNARQRVDLNLRVGQVSEIINVEATTPLLEADSSSKGQVIAAKQVVELPLQGRSYANLALLSPGVRQSTSGNQGGIATRREGSYNVNGLRSVWNNFLLDGIDNNFYGTTNQGYSNQSIQPSPDSVAEFRLIVNAYSAEFGRSGGAVMNAATKSGTNAIHGAVWEFLQNEKLNATGFFKPTLNQKPINKRNQFGAAVGGPIIKDRTFFFADYEGSRWTVAPFSLTSVPTTDMRNGILPLDVRAPHNFVDDTGRSWAAGTVFAAGTRVPMTRFARRVMAELPQANRAGSGLIGIGTNFGGTSLQRLTDDKGAVKIDHKLSNNINTFFRYAHRKQDIFAPGLITGFAGGNDLGTLDTFNQQGIAGLTWSKSATEVLEYRFAVTRLGMDRLPAAVGGPSMRELFGITGLPEGPRIQGGITPQDIQGFPRFGRQSTNPQAQFPTTINSRLNLSKIINRHNLKMGYEFLQLNIVVDDTNPLYGIDGFGGFYSRIPGQNLGALAGASANTVNSLADFYFGSRSSYQLATQVQANARQQAHWFYIQDDFKVNNKLTLNMGLRYEMTTPTYDKDNKLANFDPTQNKLITASSGSIENRTLQRQTWNNFAPRIGAAYQLNSKTVLRGGYGFGWNYWNRMASAEYLNTNAPFVTRFSTQNSPAQLGNLCTANNYVNCFRSREQGYPTNPASNVILYVDKNTPWGYVQNWHFTIQRKLFKDTLLDVAYVGNRADRLPVLGDFNQARPITQAELSQGLTTIGTLLARRPYQGFNNITAVVPTGFSNYNSFQLKFEHRGNWVTILNAFTYGKAIDTVGQVLEGSVGGSPNPQDIRNVANDKGASSFDQRWNNTTSFVLDIPFGKGRKFGRDMHRALDTVAGGWQVSSIINTQSGLPLNLRYPDAAGILSDGQPDFLGNVALRPNVINGSIGVLAPEAERSYTNYFNRANLAIPAVTSPFGNLGRNVAYGFPLYQTDLVLSKSIALPVINEVARLQFRSEFYNMFNKTNFQQPTIDLSSGNFGRVTSTFDPRYIQFALKLIF
ncbi:MAG: TonB-dependent receptor [Acidobacteria bacterium]|nr:TonB-dependent receptor [Acidobacteriota bacterium]